MQMGLVAFRGPGIGFRRKQGNVAHPSFLRNSEPETRPPNSAATFSTGYARASPRLLQPI